MVDSNQTQTATHDRALAELDVIVGKWAGAGQNKSSAPQLAGAPVTTEASYEWLPGTFFLVYRGWLDFGQKLEALRAIGYDASRQQYAMHAFDSMGFARVYYGSVSGNVWRFAGEYERVEIRVSSDAQSMTTNWERAEDGWNWQPLCEFTETKTA